MDLVNADFSSPEEVDKILDAWEEQKPGGGSTHHRKDDEEEDVQEGVAEGVHGDLAKEMGVMFRRHFSIMARDPILCLGRCIIILVTNTVFGLVYWSAREHDQSQALNKHFLNIWCMGVPTNSKFFLFCPDLRFHCVHCDPH